MRFLGFLIVGAVAALWYKLFLSNSGQRERIEALKKERVGEGFESFAAAEELLGVDPRIVKGVWDGLQNDLLFTPPPVPIRPSDRLEVLAPDQGAMDALIEDLLVATDRVADIGPPEVPVVTVGDLVRSIDRHPMRRPPNGGL